MLSLFGFQIAAGQNKSVLIKTELAITDDHISDQWKEAVKSRLSNATIDSLAQIKRPLTSAEKDWKILIESKTTTWKRFKDSLEVPFNGLKIADTITVLMGFTGADDGFTYKEKTICFDVTALQKNYGNASLSENHNRIDRIFAHELTHLMHKKWAVKNQLQLKTFKDSILWECLYEGLGMYRSLSPKWLPKNIDLPEISTTAMEKLTPVFVQRLVTVVAKVRLSEKEKKQIQRNLSRGPVDKKWGAFPVAIWLSLEANGDDRNLIPWIDKGPQAVILLAKKYLTGTNKSRFEAIFE